MCDIVSDMLPGTDGHAILTLENPATGETYGLLARASDSGGELLRLRWTAAPGAAVGEHVHPHQEESFAVTAGVLTVAVDGVRTEHAAGATVTVPAGQRHLFANRGPVPVAATLELRPALRMEEVFESLAGMARDGRVRRGGLPRNPLLLAVFAHEFRNEIRGARPPAAVQRLLLPALARLGRARGYRAHPPEYRAAVAGRRG